MEEFAIGKTPFSKVAHIGIVVRDLDAAVAYYQSLGIGPSKEVGLTFRIAERTVRGKSIELSSVKNKAMKAKMGDLELEVVQPVCGQSPAAEFLEAKGEGINHLGFLVEDIDAEIARLEGKGLKVVFGVKFHGGGGAAFFDIGGKGELLFELIQYPKL